VESDEEQIRELVQTWMSATKTGDLDTVLSLMADDAVFLIAGHPPMIGKAAYAAAASQSEPDQERPRFDGRSEIQEIKVLGDWAYMWTKLRVVVTPRGGAQSVARAGHTLTVLKKHNGKWLLARDANMLSPVSEGTR
jgi:uncharacterized protein (TIGR02246 family)